MQYALIGNRLEKEHPEIYSKLKATYLSTDPQETDLSKVNLFYPVYQSIHQATTGTMNMVQDRRVFIAVMFHYYSPHVFNQPTKYRVPKLGLSKKISQVMGITESEICRLIGQGLTWYKTDENFKRKVDQTMEALKASVLNYGSTEKYNI